MKTSDVVTALAALAHEYRLGIYRMLVEQGPEGLSAGIIGERIGLQPSSLTFHLQALQRAGLISQTRSSRQLIYCADFAVMNEVVGFLTDKCCSVGSTCDIACAPERVLRPVRRKQST